MIRMVASGIARFVEEPMGTLAAMRPVAPPFRVGIMALVACTLCMVVIDLIYGPFAYPNSLEPGGKRALPAFSIATVEIIRIFGVAATLWIGHRLLLGGGVRSAEVVWLTVPYAIALIGFELVQVGSWVLYLATGVNIYGPMVVIGFGAAFLVLTVSVRALAPDRDWLACLPIAVAAFAVGTFYPYVALMAAACFFLFDRVRALR